jgi:hypothetical protein
VDIQELESLLRRTEQFRKMVVSIGGEAFVEALHLYGPTAVTDHLVKLSSKQDWMVDELLAKLPTISNFMKFFQKMTPFNVDEEVLMRCMAKDPDYLKKQGIL